MKPLSEKIYGRKIVKGTHNGKSEYYKRLLYVSWGVCALIGLIVGVVIGLGISSSSKDESFEPKITSLGEYEEIFLKGDKQ